MEKYTKILYKKISMFYERIKRRTRKRRKFIQFLLTFFHLLLALVWIIFDTTSVQCRFLCTQKPVKLCPFYILAYMAKEVFPLFFGDTDDDEEEEVILDSLKKKFFLFFGRKVFSTFVETNLCYL